MTLGRRRQNATVTRRGRALDLRRTEERTHVTRLIVEGSVQKRFDPDMGEVGSLDAREARSTPFDEECTVVEQRGRVSLREDDQVKCGLADLARHAHQLGEPPLVRHAP